MRTALKVGIGLAILALSGRPSPAQDSQIRAEKAKAQLMEVQAQGDELLRFYQQSLTQTSRPSLEITIPDVPPSDPHHDTFVKLRAERDRACATCHVGPPTAHHEMLGLSLVPADETLRDQLKLGKKGLVVTAVAPQSPSERGGIKERDLLIESEGKPLTTVEDFAKVAKGDEKKARLALGILNRPAVDAKQAEHPTPLPDISVRLLRDGEPREVKVPSPFTSQVFASVTFAPATQPAETSYWIGVSIDAADDTLRSHLKLRDGIGLVVTDVIPDTPAQKAGIKKSDLLLSINDKPLKTVQDMTGIVKEAKESTVSIKLRRAGVDEILKVKPAKRIATDTAESIYTVISPYLATSPWQPPVNYFVVADGLRPIVGAGTPVLQGSTVETFQNTVPPVKLDLNDKQIKEMVDQLSAAIEESQRKRASSIEVLVKAAVGDTPEQARQKSLERIDAQLKVLELQIKELKASMESLNGSVKHKDQAKPR
jgi:S1-C subfamily serine protease